MKDGNWRPLSKYLVKYFPKHRPYTKLEAAFCLQCDYDDHNEVTVSGYSALWQWSRKKVNLFLEQMNIEIIYPENTQKTQNQKGYVSIQKPKKNRKGTDKGQIRLIDFNELQTEKNRKGTDKGQITEQSQLSQELTDLKEQIKMLKKREKEGQIKSTNSNGLQTKKNTTIEPSNKILEPRKTFLSDSIEYRLADYLYRFILDRNNGFKKPNIELWVKHIDLMLRIDERKPDDIKAVIKWCQQDDFWQNNILSTQKLRQQFDQLYLKMQEPGKQPGLDTAIFD